jgi:hypothetical protein
MQHPMPPMRQHDVRASLLLPLLPLLLLPLLLLPLLLASMMI